MRHRKRGRVLGRCPSHRKAMFKNLASALFLTEQDPELLDNAPKVKGRITTTLHKAKEARPLVEKCITIAKQVVKTERDASEWGTTARRASDEWKAWRKSPKWNQWAKAMAPAVTGRRRLLQLLGDKTAVKLLVAEVAPRFVDRSGGYTRILRLSKPRLGDAGTRAILELVGVNDRQVKKAQRPAFSSDDATAAGTAES